MPYDVLSRPVELTTLVDCFDVIAMLEPAQDASCCTKGNDPRRTIHGKEARVRFLPGAACL
jgi:hypothetical protein